MQPAEVNRNPAGAAKYAALALLLALCPAYPQVPVSGTLSDTDWPLFRAEVARIEKLLASAPDQAAVTYQMARTWASARQWPEALQWLRKAAAMKAGIDPSRDVLFGDLAGTREFAAILTAVRAATTPVSHSTPAFVVREGDLVPESIAYNPRSRQFFLGSMRKGRILRCSATGDCTGFATGLGTVLGLKVHGDALWALSNSDADSALLHYDLASGRMLRKYAVAGAGHNFNDLVIAPSGDIYLTDTPAGAVWQLPHGATGLARLAGRIRAANGIALSPDGRLLYISSFPDGITILDLRTRAATPIARPPELCLATIDGLSFHRGSLIAIQNGFMSPRVVRLTLAGDLRGIARFEVLERRNPLFNGVTTGVVVGGDFFYMANIQDDRKTGFDPITILKLHL